MLGGPVDEVEGLDDDIGGEEVVRIGKEARGGNCPNQPVEAVSVNGAADDV